MIYLKIISFLIYLIFMGILFTKYTSLHGIFLIPYSLLILIEYALFIKTYYKKRLDSKEVYNFVFYNYSYCIFEVYTFIIIK